MGVIRSRKRRVSALSTHTQGNEELLTFSESIAFSISIHFRYL